MDGLCQTRGVDQQSEKAPGVAGWCLRPLKGSAAAERKDKEAGSRKAGGYGGNSLSACRGMKKGEQLPSSLSLNAARWRRLEINQMPSCLAVEMHLEIADGER